MSAELLYTCPRCGRHGYQLGGLRQHICRGSRPGDIKRRLAPIEIEDAVSRNAAVRAATVARFDELIQASRRAGSPRAERPAHLTP